jgi:hypothetical protein
VYALALDSNADVSKVTEGEGNIPLQTTTCFGVPESACLIVEKFPGLSLKSNAEG